MENHHLVSNSGASKYLNRLPECMYTAIELHNVLVHLLQAAAFDLLQQDDYDFLKYMPPKARVVLRKQVIEAVVSNAFL
jgi:hypothetical protein